MENLLIWSLKSSAILVVLFTCYYFLFRSNTAFRLRRVLLIGILGLCCLAPTFEIKVSEQNPLLIQKAVELKTIAMVEVNPINYSSYHNNPAPIPEQRTNSIDWRAWALKAYGIGILISLGLLLFELGKVFYLRASGKRDHTMGRLVFRHSRISSPFSFFRWIFIPQDAQYESNTWKIIDTHEQAHVQKRHSIDLLLSRIAQSVMWFNPIIYLLQRELRSVHEAQADEAVLKNTSLSTYAQTLMQVSLPGYQLPIGHSFAVISSFSKRLKLMKTHKTRIRTTIISLLIISTFSIGIIGWSSLKGQDKMGFQDFNTNVEDSPERQEAFQEARKRFRQLIPFMVTNKLSEKHSKIIALLREENPEKDIRFKYYSESNFKSYYDNFIPGFTPLYISQLSKGDKENLTEIYLNDSTIINMNGTVSYNNNGLYFKYQDFMPDVSEAINNNANYIMMYEYVYNPTEYDASLIYDISEVDQAPQVMGGIENMVKTIALDITVPEDLDRSKIPDTVDFEFVVQGGRNVSHINLLTELKGSDKRNEPYYKFFGEVHNMLRSKISSLYAWKRGKKDGKEVRVRMKISIPTKYMM